MMSYTEQMKMLQEAKDAKVGDKISCKGITCTIGEIFYYDKYVETGHPMFKESKDEDTYYVFYDIEFKDSNGNYRHWKSSYDGGKLIPA